MQAKNKGTRPARHGWLTLREESSRASFTAACITPRRKAPGTSRPKTSDRDRSAGTSARTSAGTSASTASAVKQRRVRRLTIAAAADNRTPEQIVSANASADAASNATLQHGGRKSGPRDYGQERLNQANQSPRCQHVKTNGGQCKAPAVRGNPECHFHGHVLHTNYSDYQLPIPEDAASIHWGLTQVIRALSDKIYDTKTCALMLYALQLAGSNLKRLEAERMLEEEPAKSTLGDPVTAMLKRLGLYDAADEREQALKEAAAAEGQG